MVGRLIESAYRIFGYHISSLAYSFKDKDVREEALLDRLRIYGTSIVEINMALDRMPTRIPNSVRLPELLVGRDELIDRMNSSLLEILNHPDYKRLERDEKARKIAENISNGLHSELAYDPEVFKHIMVKPLEKHIKKEQTNSEPEFKGNVRIAL